MIEPPRLVGKILNGEKTQLRTPRVPGRECQWRVGHTYGVRAGPDKPVVTRIKVTSVRDQLLHEVTDEEARAEGFVDAAEFLHEWYLRHGNGPGRDRHLPGWPFARIPIWVLTVELDLEAPPRLLGRRPHAVGPGASRDAELGYVSNPKDALEDAGEAVDEATQQRQSADAAARFATLRREEREREDTRRQIARLRELRARARDSGEEVPEISEIDKLLRRAEARLAER